MPQKIINIGRVVAGLGFAKTGCWQLTGRDGDIRVMWLSVHTVKRGKDTAASIIVGPFSVIIGIRPTHNGGESE